MEPYCQCLRCGKRIPIRPEMVGQTILCPSCLDRVYVTPADQSPPKPTSASGGGIVEPTLSPSAAAALARLKNPGEEAGRSLPIGLIAGLGGVAVLVLIGALVMWGSKPTKKAGQQAAGPGEAASTLQPSTTENYEQPASSFPKPPMRELSPEFRPARPPTAAPTTIASNNPSLPSPNTQPLTTAGVTAPAGSASPVSLNVQPQTLGENWAELWRSPSVSSSEPAALASVGEAPTPWRIAVRSAVPDLRMGAHVLGPNLVVEPSSDQSSWTIKYAPNPQAATEKESLAILRRDGPNLVFAWATPLASSQARQNVANCLLEVSAGSARRVAQLREPLRMEPIALDLATEKQIVEAQIDNPPRVDALRLEISELSGFSFDAKLRGGVKTAAPPPQPGAMPSPLPSAPLGMLPHAPLHLGPQPLVIECEEIPGLEIRVRFARAEPSGKLTIAVEPVLCEGPKAEFDLRVPKILDRLETEVQKPLVNAQRELGPAEAGLKRWQTDVEKLKSSEPRTKDVQRHAKWQFNVRDHTNWVMKFNKEVTDLKQKIKTYQMRIEVVAKLRSFLEDSHHKALIHYVVYSECGQPDLLLVDGRGQR